METRSEFHARRAKGIGGSDVGAILGLDRYRTPQQLWEEKCGMVQQDDTMSPDQERGVVFEPIALQRYSQRSGNSIIPGDSGQHPDYPWMLYTLDGYEIADGEQIPVEVKCPSLGMWSRIKREGLPDSWVLQMQHYLCCTDQPRGRYVIFCADRMETLDFVIEADLLLHEMLIEKEREFWICVETQQPPPEVVAEIVGQEIVVVGTVTKRYDDEFAAAAATLREAKQLSKTAAELEDSAKAQLLELVENQPGIYEVPGVGRIHYAVKPGRTTFDSKALANSKPLDRIATMANVLQAINNIVPKAWAGETIEQILRDCDLDLSAFEKQGKSYVELRAYFGKGE